MWIFFLSFPGGSDGRACLQCGRPGFNSWVRKIPWKWKWQPTPVFLPGISYGKRSLAGCSLWGCQESDTTEQLQSHMNFLNFFFDSIGFLLESLGLSLQNIISYMRIDSFTCSFPIWMTCVPFFSSTSTSSIHRKLQESLFLLQCPTSTSTEKHNIDATVEERFSVERYCLSQVIYWKVYSELRVDKLVTDSHK